MSASEVVGEAGKGIEAGSSVEDEDTGTEGGDEAAVCEVDDCN